MSYTDYKLEDRFYYDQKLIPNPDGSSNMISNSKYGRFSYCFIASSAAGGNQTILRLRKKGYNSISSFKTSYVDPVAYRAILVSRLNEEGNAWVDDSGRFLWDNHKKLLNELIQNSFTDKINGEWFRELYSKDKVIKSIRNGFQVIMGINIKHHYKAGAGHVVCVTGWRENNETGEFLGYWINDPAGNLIGPKSYRNNEISGEDVFYPAKELKYMINGANSIMWFEEKKNDKN